jgi:hypothetical protein
MGVERRMWSWFTPFQDIWNDTYSLNTSGSFIVANVNRELLINEPYISHNSLAVKFALLDVPPAC